MNTNTQLPENTEPTILLVEDCLFTRRAICKALETGMPECKIISVQSIKAAQAVGAELAIDLFIVDEALPDGCGIDFLADMMMVHAEAGSIVMIEGGLPAHVENYEWFENVQILRKAIDRAQLLRLMREILHNRKNRADRGGSNLWSARLEEIPPDEIMHLKLDSQATTILEFVSRGETGLVHFENGRVIDAEAGELWGNEALRKISNWRRGYAFEIPVKTEVKPAIDSHFQHVSDPDYEVDQEGEDFQDPYSILSHEIDDVAFAGVLTG